MPNHFCVSRQTAEEFMRLFANRLAYGIQVIEPDGSAGYKNRFARWDWAP